MGLKKYSHSVGEYVYHFIFLPKYRKRRLVGRIKERLLGMIKFCAQVNEWEILELSIELDHVHILLQTNSDDSPASIMQAIKGGTSKKLREMFPDLAESTWLSSSWSDGYYGSTVGTRDPERLRDYVSEQRRHHGDNKGEEPADF